MRASVIIKLCVLVLGVSSNAVTTLGPADTARLQQVLSPGWDLQDLPSLMYAASSFKHLNIAPPNVKDACTFAGEFLNGNPSTEVIFQASSTASYLGCPLSASARVKQTLGSSINEGAALVEVYHAVIAMARLGVAIDSPKVLAITQAALKRDDSVLNLGYAFHIGSQLSGNVSPLYNLIEDAVVQADEVDGRLLQFEGGLSITALVIDGAYKLCEKSGRTMPIKAIQAVKFSNYLLSRKSVQLAKSIHYLLHALTTLTTNKYHLPVVLSITDGASASASKPTLKVMVTDLLGSQIPGGVAVVADNIIAEAGGATIATGVSLKALPGGSLFELDVMSLKPTRGFYSLTLSAKGSDKRLVGNTKTKLTFKVLTSISVEDVQFGTADLDQSTSSSLKKIPYGSKMAGLLEADHHQKLVMKFNVIDGNKPTTLHQVFVRVKNTETQKEVIFVAEQDPSNLYKFEMSVTGSGENFGYVSGTYSCELILGDATISNPLKWDLADVRLLFPQQPSVLPSHELLYQVKPEIEHQFSTPDPRPPKLVSLVFTALCLSPALLMLVLWGKLGANISNFKFTLTGIGFHLGLGGVLGLFVVFWVQLNMFSTLRYLTIVGAFTFYCGNKLLSSIAAASNKKLTKN